MKRSKRIYALCGVLLVVCIATIGVMKFEEHKENIKNSNEIILELPIDTVQSLSWEYSTESLAFHKDGKWLYDDDEAFPVNEEKIEELLELFEEFGASFVIEDVDDYGQYGLDSPVCTIDLATDDQTYEILVGNYSDMDSQRYISIGDGNVYLVETDPMGYFSLSLKSMINHDEIPYFSNVTAIKFEGIENYSIVYEEDSDNTYCNDDVYFAKQGGQLLPLDTSRVDSYMDNVSYLYLTDYVTYNASDEELKEYGLDEPELTLTVDYTSTDDDGEEVTNTFVLNISRDSETKKASENETQEESNDSDDDSADEDFTAYVRVGESQIIYSISSDEYDELIDASYDAFRHLEVLSADFSDIEKIDISLEGDTYTITSEEDDERTYFYQDEELEIADLQSALKNLSASSFTDEQPTKKEEVSLTVYLNNEKYPKVVIELYRYDSSNCIAVVDGTPVSFVTRSAVVNLIEAINAIVLE